MIVHTFDSFVSMHSSLTNEIISLINFWLCLKKNQSSFINVSQKKKKKSSFNGLPNVFDLSRQQLYDIRWHEHISS